jgi:uncharacterized membrane protein YphA (DoxX/SURF4 family)
MRLGLLFCRLIVGIAFVNYGLVKLLGGQFYHGDFVIDSRNTEGTWLVWCFFGYSPVYARFVGVCELVPGLLVLWPRTSTFGAMALLAVSLNITVMDFCFDFPAVKYTALSLTLLCGILVASDYRRLKGLFWDHPSSELPYRARPNAKAGHGETAPKPLAHSNLKRALTALLGICLAMPFLNFVALAATPGPEEPALARCAAEGWDASQLQVRRWWRTSGTWGIGMEGYVDLEVAGSGDAVVLRVRMQRPSGFVPWRAVEVQRLQ